MRKICIVIGSRANYSSIKSAMHAIKQHPDLKLQVVANASAVLSRYGAVADLIESDGFKCDAKIFTLIEGETPTTMAQSTGLGLIELPTIFSVLKPDVVLTIGDRFETMSTAIAATYMNIPLAHTMGGEVTGNIDESIRHAISKFANIHFAACEDARQRIIRLGEEPSIVHNTGCPRIDLIAKHLKEDIDLDGFIRGEGVGMRISTQKEFLIVSQHAVTSEYGDGETQIFNTLLAVYETFLPAIILWPNADAGAEDVSRGIRKFREQYKNAPFQYIKNLPISVYVHLMTKTKCLVGNSSSGIRDGAFIGTPAINIGSRQNRRMRGKNVIDSNYDIKSLKVALENRLSLKEKFPSDIIYGDGKAGERIASLLAECSLKTHKTISY